MERCSYCGEPVRGTPLEVGDETFCSEECLEQFETRDEEDDYYGDEDDGGYGDDEDYGHGNDVNEGDDSMYLDF